MAPASDAVEDCSVRAAASGEAPEERRRSAEDGLQHQDLVASQSPMRAALDSARGFERYRWHASDKLIQLPDRKGPRGLTLPPASPGVSTLGRLGGPAPEGTPAEEDDSRCPELVGRLNFYYTRRPSVDGVCRRSVDGQPVPLGVHGVVQEEGMPLEGTMEISLPEEDSDDEAIRRALFVKLGLEGGRDCSISVKRRRKILDAHGPHVVHTVEFGVKAAREEDYSSVNKMEDHEGDRSPREGAEVRPRLGCCVLCCAPIVFLLECFLT